MFFSFLEVVLLFYIQNSQKQAHIHLSLPLAQKEKQLKNKVNILMHRLSSCVRISHTEVKAETSVKPPGLKLH